MSSSARQPLAAWRNEACAFPITVVGLNLTGAALRMQVRLAPGTPGAPRVDLATVTNNNAEGLRLVSATQTDGVWVSVVQLRINKSTLQGLPYAGELGSPAELAYALQVAGVTRMHGAFYVLDSAIDSDGAPINRPEGFGGTAASDATSMVVLTITDSGVTINLGGGDVLAGAVEAALDASAVAVEGQRLTRDPWQRIRQKVGPYLYGTTSAIVNARPVTVRTTINVVVLGNSHGVGQGASPPNAPGEQFKRVLEALFPEVLVVVHVYAVPGSWQTQMGEQIDEMVADGIAPDFALILDPSNDARVTIYHSLEGPEVYRERLTENIKLLQNMGAVVISHTTPPRHPTRSLTDSDAFDFSEAFFVSWPTVSWVAGDDFQGFIFDPAEQTITSTTTGQFTIFSPGWVVPGQWLRMNDTGEFFRIVDVDPTGTTVTVNDGNDPPGPGFTRSGLTTSGMRIAKIDARTQLVPARNNNDLSRPAGVPADVTLSVEPRDLNGDGVMINVAVRDLSMNTVCREATAQAGAVLADWAAPFQRLLTSNAAYDTLYSDDVHPNDAGYLPLTPIYENILFGAFRGVLPGASA